MVMMFVDLFRMTNLDPALPTVEYVLSGAVIPTDLICG
jgi:hypothetical protein